MIKTLLRKSDDEIAVILDARRQVAAGTASLDLIERAYRILERHRYDKKDDPVLAAAMDAGIVQCCFLEQGANGIEGWERLQLRHAGGRREPLQVLVYRQENPKRLRFDIDVEMAAARIAKALPKTDPRQREIATLTLSRVAVQRLLNAQVATPVGGRLSDDAVKMIHRISDGWDDHHCTMLVGIAETPAFYAVTAQVPA